MDRCGQIVLFDASATQRTDSQFNGPSVLREASALSSAALPSAAAMQADISGAATLESMLNSTSAALPSAAAMQADISGAATLESMLNSTPEGQLMFRTVTVVAAGDQQKYEEIAKKYDDAPEKYEELVWIAGDKKLHPFKWNGPAQCKPHSKRSGIWESYQFKDILLQAKMNLKLHDNFLDSMSISGYNNKAKEAMRMVVYEHTTVGEWWQVMFQAKNLVGWQSVLQSLGYIGAQDLESKEDVLVAIEQVLEADFRSHLRDDL